MSFLHSHLLVSLNGSVAGCLSPVVENLPRQLQLNIKICIAGACALVYCYSQCEGRDLCFGGFFHIKRYRGEVGEEVSRGW